MNINHLLNKPGPSLILDDIIILKVWQTVTLQPFDLQRLAVLLWKDLDPLVNIISAQNTSSFFKIGFCLFKLTIFTKGLLLVKVKAI